jgi:hypothetical protein
MVGEPGTSEWIVRRKEWKNPLIARKQSRDNSVKAMTCLIPLAVSQSENLLHTPFHQG